MAVALLTLTVLVCAATFALLLAGGSVAETGIRVAWIVFLMLAPSLALVAAWDAPRGVRAVRRLFAGRRDKAELRPGGPPVEQIAADLRRLLWQHDALVRANGVAARARRLWALELAIGDVATQAARALGVPQPDWAAHGGFDRAQLRRLLRAIAAEGLVLPSTVGLMAPDRHR
jgi:hypothetical protein